MLRQALDTKAPPITDPINIQAEMAIKKSRRNESATKPNGASISLSGDESKAVDVSSALATPCAKPKICAITLERDHAQIKSFA